MMDPQIDGRLQVTAALGLLEFSRIIGWNRDHAKFSAVSREEFELCWKNDVHPVFGRLVCWICFSAGAEFLAKGVCILQGIPIRRNKKVPCYPTTQLDLAEWAVRFCGNPNFAGTLDVVNYGTLRDLTGKDAQSDGALQELCRKMKAAPKDQSMLLSAYILLARTIRNRDAHAYVPNVRNEHFSLAPRLFEDALNLLVSWLPCGPEYLNIWIRDSAIFIKEL